VYHGPHRTISYEKGLKLKRSGNEGYYMNSFILLVKNMLCNKLHCQKVLNRKSFHIRSGCGADLRTRGGRCCTPPPAAAPRVAQLVKCRVFLLLVKSPSSSSRDHAVVCFKDKSGSGQLGRGVGAILVQGLGFRV